MAFNNHFFFSKLHHDTTTPSKAFIEEVKICFDSMDTLRTEMIETADALFGNGFVWLVKDDGLGMLRILCTYNAGSPLPQAHYRRQSRDMNTVYEHVGRNAAETRRLNNVQNTAGNFGRFSTPTGKLLAPTDALTGGPVLCVGVWQHMWLRDYGVGAKRSYLENWWDRIDWTMVESSARDYGPEARLPKMTGLQSTLNRSMNRPY